MAHNNLLSLFKWRRFFGNYSLIGQTNRNISTFDESAQTCQLALSTFNKMLRKHSIQELVGFKERKKKTDFLILFHIWYESKTFIYSFVSSLGLLGRMKTLIWKERITFHLHCSFLVLQLYEGNNPDTLLLPLLQTLLFRSLFFSLFDKAHPLSPLPNNIVQGNYST